MKLYLDATIAEWEHQNPVVFDIVYGLTRQVNIEVEDLYLRLIQLKIEPAPRLQHMMDR